MAPEYIEHRLMRELDANVLKRPLNTFGTPAAATLSHLKNQALGLGLNSGSPRPFTILYFR